MQLRAQLEDVAAENEDLILYRIAERLGITRQELNRRIEGVTDD